MVKGVLTKIVISLLGEMIKSLKKGEKSGWVRLHLK